MTEVETYTEAEAAIILRISRRSLMRRRHQGKISAIKDGHYIRYTKQHLLEYQRTYLRKVAVDANDLNPEVLIGVLKRKLLLKRPP